MRHQSTPPPPAQTDQQQNTASPLMALWEQFRGQARPRSRVYRIWKLMHSRCGSPHLPDYRYYGGRGIRVCERWHTFAHFLADMGEPPTPLHTIDRHPDPHGNYEPGNCRWATRKEQSRNISTNRHLTHGGKTLCLSEWAEVIGLDASTLRKRLSRGWSVLDTLTVPGAGRGPKRKGVSDDATPQEVPAVPQEGP